MENKNLLKIGFIVAITFALVLSLSPSAAAGLSITGTKHQASCSPPEGGTQWVYTYTATNTGSDDVEFDSLMISFPSISPADMNGGSTTSGWSGPSVSPMTGHAGSYVNWDKNPRDPPQTLSPNARISFVVKTKCVGADVLVPVEGNQTYWISRGEGDNYTLVAYGRDALLAKETSGSVSSATYRSVINTELENTGKVSGDVARLKISSNSVVSETIDLKNSGLEGATMSNPKEGANIVITDVKVLTDSGVLAPDEIIINPGETATLVLEGNEEKSDVPMYLLLASVILCAVLFTAGFKTGNNLFYALGVGSLIAGGLIYVFYPHAPAGEPTLPGLLTSPTVKPAPGVLEPIKQLDLLLINADKNKDSGDIAAEKLDLLKALDISLENNLPDKTEEIETKLSDTTRREATENRRSGKYEDAIKSTDESIEYDPDNPWSYVEGIINSEELDNHDDAVNYAEDLDEVMEHATDIPADFTLDTQTANEYKDYAVDLNDEGTGTAKTAETADNIADATNAIETGAEYIGEALMISETLDIAGVSDTPTGTVVGNLVSANNNLIVLQTQAGKFSAAKNAANDTLEIIEEYTGIVPGVTKSGVLSNTATVYALSGDYRDAIDYGKLSLSNNPDNAGANNVIASSLTALGGKENVMGALEYIQKAIEIDPENELYAYNLNTIQGAIENEDWYDIELNFGVGVVEMPEGLITCCIPDSCTMTTVEECISTGGAVTGEIPVSGSVSSAPPQNFTPFDPSTNPGWWRNLTRAVNESPIVTDNWTYTNNTRICHHFANNLTEYLRGLGYNATFTIMYYNTTGGLRGHSVSDVYAPNGNKVFIEPQWIRIYGLRYQAQIPKHDIGNGTQAVTGMDADGDGRVEARNGVHNQVPPFNPTDDNVVIEQFKSRSEAISQGVNCPGA
ncbi:MAG: hypothetical protein A7315_09990 [Candidatus Altiarchaeales archaeon WOR_SM1_79]|nr:MAG: hypothetical protein A7315_09990 [Candidatus Altiarchaeales archaeon WOR_SM1_79]